MSGHPPFFNRLVRTLRTRFGSLINKKIAFNRDITFNGDIASARRLCAERRQKRVGHHRESDVSVPTVPVAHLIVVQARLPFCFLDALFDGIAR